MPFFDYEMLHKLLSPAEEKKIQVFMNYILYDVFSEKLSYPTFYERMKVLNQQKNFDLFKIFKEICGPNRKYITYPRFIEAFMGYQLNSKLFSIEVKNFIAFVNNELVFDYNDKFLGNTSDKEAKEFSTKNMVNRTALTNIQVFNNSHGEIVGLKFVYDEKYQNLFLAPAMKEKEYQLKINCNLVINDFFLDEEDKNNPEVDNEFARDYITHIFGTHSHIIESLGFKTAFGKHYFTGKPMKGKQFLLGTSKKRFHYMKFGMNTNLNYATFKFLPALANPNLNRKVREFTNDDFHYLFADELVLKDMVDGPEKDEMIKVPISHEKDFMSHDHRDGDFSGDSLDDVCFSSEDDEENEDIKIRKIINKISEKEYTDVLLSSYEKYKDKKKQIKLKLRETERKKREVEKDREQRVLEGLEPDFDEEDFDIRGSVGMSNRNRRSVIAKAVTFAPSEQRKSISGGNGLKSVGTVGSIDMNKVTYEDVRFKFAKDILLADFAFNPYNVDVFIQRYAKNLKDEIDQQVNLTEKKKNMQNDFYIRQLNRNKEIKDWDALDVETKYDPFRLKSEFAKISKGSDIMFIKNDAIPEDRYDNPKVPEDFIIAKWRKFRSFISRKKTMMYLRQITLVLAQAVLQEYESDKTSNYDINDKIRIFKLINKLRFDKNIILSMEKENTDPPEEELPTKKTLDQKDIQAIQKKKTKVNLVTTSKKFDEDIIHAEEEAMKLKEKKDISKNKPAYTDKEIEKIWKDYNKMTMKDIMEHLEEQKNILSQDIREYNKLLKLGICDTDDTRNLIENLVDDLKRMKRWFDNKITIRGKNAILNNTNINIDEHIQNEIEKRKQYFNINKKEKRAEKAKEEEKQNNQILAPIKSSEAIKTDSRVKIYREQEICKSGKFVDTLFQADITRLCPVDDDQNFVLPDGCEEEDIEGFDGYQWTTFEKIFKGKNYQVFLDKVEENDILQGGLGDCYFLSAIAALTKFPELIKGLFPFQERSEEGCYAVKFRINGAWKLVLVDENIPGDGAMRPDFAFSSAHGNELWVILLEKAWAKLCGNFAKACAGMPSEVFDCICDSVSENIDVSPSVGEEIWAKLKEGKENNFIMTAGTSGSQDIDCDAVNLVPGHAYTVLDSYEVVKSGIKVRLVKLRNPWGNSEFSGDWSDSSSMWTDKLRKEVGLTDADDGVFFMSLEDFLHYCMVFSICRIYPSFKGNRMKIPRENTTKPVITKVEIRENGKYIFQVHQKNPRFVLKDGSYAKNKVCFIMLLDKAFNFIKAGSSDYHTEGFQLELTKGSYYVVSDVSYRYVDSKKLHSYNVTCIGNVPGEFFTVDEDIEAGISKAVISFSLAQVTPTVHPGTDKLGGVEVYSTLSLKSNLPYIFIVYKNNTKKDFDVGLKLRINKNRKDIEFAFNPDATEDKAVLKGGMSKAFIIRKINDNFGLEYSTYCNPIS